MPEQSHPLVLLAGSERAPLAAATPAGRLDTSERAELTLVLRRRAELRQVSSPAPKGHGTVTHRYREGPLFVPAPLDGIVLAVLGLDTRPQARPHFRARDAAAAPGDTYPPNQVADIYQFPAGTTGAGQPGVGMAGFRDITSGNNGAYTAGPGWDACSGLGSPDGTALLNRLQG